MDISQPEDDEDMDSSNIKVEDFDDDEEIDELADDDDEDETDAVAGKNYIYELVVIHQCIDSLYPFISISIHLYPSLSISIHLYLSFYLYSTSTKEA
jgi:hypothetical protein